MPAQPLSENQKQDASRLRDIYMDRKRDLGLNQYVLAERCGWNSQGTVSQYLNGKIPLNLEAALCFARELRCSVGDFSPQLGQKLHAGSPNSEPTPNKGTRRTKGASKALFQDSTPSNVLHHLPVITWEMDMEDLQGIGRWRADDDYITRELHAPKGWWIIVDTRVQFAPGDIVLIRGACKSLALRRVIGELGALHLVTLSGADAPTPTNGDEIVGVACGSFMEMVERLP